MWLLHIIFATCKKVNLLYKIISSLLIGIFMSMLLMLATPTTSNAEPVVSCKQVRIDVNTVRIDCTVAGILAAPIYVELPSVPPITLPPVEVEVPVPGETETVTVQVPGQTQTVTQEVTETVTLPPEPNETITVTPEPQNNSPSALPTGQDPSQDDTLEPIPEPSQPEDNEPIIKTIVEKAALGLLSIIILVGLLLLGMYLGYYIGYKDSDQANARFMRALRDSIISRN